jgi:hypothetical protein
MFKLEIGGLELAMGIGGNEVIRQFGLHMSTPWWDFAIDANLNREKSIKACVLCSNLPKNCECEEPVLVNPLDMQESLLQHDHSMFHFLNDEEDCG